MKIAIIGTTSYLEKMENHKRILLDSFGRHYIRLPRFDSDGLNELEICEKNREMIEWADEVHIFWDQRSMGTVFDFGMCFALRKPVKVIYLEPKTMAGVMKRYEEKVVSSYREWVDMITRSISDRRPIVFRKYENLSNSVFI